MTSRRNSKGIDQKQLISCHHCGSYSQDMDISCGFVICPGSNVDSCTNYVLKSCNSKYHRCGLGSCTCRCSMCSKNVITNKIVPSKGKVTPNRVSDKKSTPARKRPLKKKKDAIQDTSSEEEEESSKETAKFEEKETAKHEKKVILKNTPPSPFVDEEPQEIIVQDAVEETTVAVENPVFSTLAADKDPSTTDNSDLYRFNAKEDQDLSKRNPFSMLKSDPKMGKTITNEDLKNVYLGDLFDSELLQKIIYENTVHGHLPSDERILLAHVYFQFEQLTYTCFWHDPLSVDFWQVEHIRNNQFQKMMDKR